MNTTRSLTRTALIAALLLTFQSLRLLLPLPPLASTLLIGSLVNACLILGTASGGYRGLFFISVLAPLIAYLQQLLPLPIFIPLVAGGNFFFGCLYLLLQQKNSLFKLLLPPLGKMLFLWGGVTFLLSLLTLPELLQRLLGLLLSWPQFITSLAGLLLAQLVLKRLRTDMNKSSN